MKGTDFNLATSIFFVAYLLMQLPSNMLITRVRPSLYLSGAMVLWGVVSTCNAAAHSFGGLIAVRFMLGFVEVCGGIMSVDEPRGGKITELTKILPRRPSSLEPSFS